MQSRNGRYITGFVLLAAALVILLLLNLMTGSVMIPAGEIVQILRTGDNASKAGVIVSQIRMPRMLAAMLLYLVVKNHSFSDGNKRIAATLFLWFMENNRILYASDGHKRIADNALVALTLMIAESKMDEMEMMVKVVVNLINEDNR